MTNTLTPVSYVIFRRGGSVLLQLRQGTGHLDGHWSSAAAGHVEARESAGDAACREAREELGVVIAADDLRALTTMHRPQQSSPAEGGRVDFFFTCESWAGEPTIMEPGKSAGLAWFDLDDLPEPVVPHERYVLENLRAGLAPIVAFGFSNPTTREQCHTEQQGCRCVTSCHHHELNNVGRSESGFAGPSPAGG